MTISASQFRTLFQAFRDETRFPAPIVNFYLGIAYRMLPASRWLDLLDYGVQLFAAHHLALDDKANSESSLGNAPGVSTGVISSKSAGPVSLSMDTNTSAEQGAGFWNLTTYGLRYYRLVRVVGIGGMQLGAPMGAGCMTRLHDRFATLEYSIIGKPAAGQTYQVVIGEQGTLLANCAAAQASVLTMPTAPWVFALRIDFNGTITNLGNIEIETTGIIDYPVFADTALPAGASLQLIAPAMQDATGADVAFAFRYRL